MALPLRVRTSPVVLLAGLSAASVVTLLALPQRSPSEIALASIAAVRQLRADLARRLEFQLLQDPKRRRVPNTDTRPESCPTGNASCLHHRSRGLSGVAAPVCLSQELVRDLGFVQSLCARDEPAVADDLIGDILQKF